MKDKDLVDSYLFVSAKTGQGFGDLRETIYDLMTPKMYISEHPVDARVEEYRMAKTKKEKANNEYNKDGFVVGKVLDITAHKNNSEVIDIDVTKQHLNEDLMLDPLPANKRFTVA